MRRKGELSPAGVDHGWPHQVAVPADRCTGTSTNVIREFCKDLSLCPRGHTVRWEDEWFRVYCFADPAHAAAFMARFGGETFDPKQRGKGRHWMRWNKS
jgi:hypothetical protein